MNTNQTSSRACARRAPCSEHSQNRRSARLTGRLSPRGTSRGGCRAHSFVFIRVDSWFIFSSMVNPKDDSYPTRPSSAQEVAKALGVSVARVYLAKHRVGALVKKELKRLQRKIE